MVKRVYVAKFKHGIILPPAFERLSGKEFTVRNIDGWMANCVYQDYRGQFSNAIPIEYLDFSLGYEEVPG